MTPDFQRLNLKVIYKYKFDGPHQSDAQNDADIAITNFVNDFLKRCKHLLKMNYSIIIEYNNTIYNYLAYRLVECALPLTAVKPKIFILGVCESPKEKELFKDATFINAKKAKKIKKAVYITGHHPIYNVKNFTEISNQFNTVVNPLERFTPPQINKLIDFYVEDDNPLKTRIDEDDYIYKFYQYPVGTKNDELPVINIIPKEIYLFKLSGTTDDIKCYDFILEKSKEGIDAIFLYQVDSAAAAEFTKLNLNPWLQRYLVPNDFNIIIGRNEVLHPTKTYSYKDFMEG